MRPLALLAFCAIAATGSAAQAVQATAAASLPQLVATTPVQDAIRGRLATLAGGQPVVVRLPVALSNGTLADGTRSDGTLADGGTGAEMRPQVALNGGDALQRFYAARTYSPAWEGADAEARLRALLSAIEDSADHGLEPARYHQAFLRQALDTVLTQTAGEPPAPQVQADLDLAASDAFLTLARHYMAGQVRPQSFDPEWTIHAGAGDAVPLLNSATQTGNLKDALRAVIPHQPGYNDLLLSLRELREMAANGPWPVVPEGESLKPGMFDLRVPVLRARLIASGDLAERPDTPVAPGANLGDWAEHTDLSAAPDDIETSAIAPASLMDEDGAPATGQSATAQSATAQSATAQADADGEPSADKPFQVAEIYDNALVAAVLRFQRRHGLEPDGVVGPKTLAALNVPLADRIRQVELNLERWRWLPADLGRRYVLVNIAGYDYRLVEDGVEKLYGRTIVGRSYRSTPVFSDKIEYLVFNPKWTVPRRLAVEDKLPQIKEDPDFLRREGFSVYVGWGEDAQEIMPEFIDWHSLSKNNFPYRLVQSPGASNALGQVKFLFPNKYDVYLHDTPSRHLFKRANRAFSSGCIRVEHPLDLAEHLLMSEPGWDRARIDGALQLDRERWITLREPVPVHLLHWTTWRDPDGTLQFRDDLYGRDSRLAQALARQSMADAGN
ncbi:murein L,D-transpeptidase [Marinibaculum pumilum]|uniref:Murein L,D-transpeptidase n=1 Tax=Marinibaculum pumilum TaxID=1766165 RepID=A0ABV7KW34_9PROT